MKKRLTMFLACLLLSIGIGFAQQKVTGTVLEDNGEPCIGATVMIQGSKQGTKTDLDGHFSINVPDKKKLVISYIGMKTVTVTPKNGMKVTLEPDANTIQEVVAVGMMKQDKRLFTGASTKISAEDAKLDGVADISRSLEGRAAGVSVQNVSGTFGTAPKIRVRGATSILGGSKPLWVVDGVIMEDVIDVDANDLSSGDANTLISSAIAGLNSDDIESFQILKDGSATSIYGARAMAGVIVITTKKGKAGQSQINYTGEFTMRLKPSYSTFNIMNSQEQMSVYQEMQQKGYLNYAELSNAASSGIYGKMYQLISQYDATSGQYGLPNTTAARADYLRQAEFRNTDWFDQLFSNSIQHNHSVSISSGTEKAQTRASLSAMYDPGWTKQSDVQRYTASMNTNFNISPKVTFTMIANASYRKQRAPGTLSSELDPVTGAVNRSFDINPYSYALNTSRALDPAVFYTRNYAPFNILDELDKNYMDLDVFTIRVQGELKYKPIKKVELSALAAYEYAGSSNTHNILDDSNQAKSYRAMDTSTIRDKNNFLYKDPDNPYARPISVLPNGGIMNKTTNKMNDWTFRASVSYNDVFKDDHIFNFFGGTEIQQIDRSNDWFRGWGMQYNMGEISAYAYQVFKQGSEKNTNYFTLTNTHDRSADFFGNATYSWKHRYTVNGTIRYEGTNKLGKSRSARWLPTWNVSAAWNAHEEPFFEKLKSWMSHATLKVSYSLTADRGPSYVTNSLPVIASDNPWRPFTGVKETSLYISSLGNDELTYEKKHEFNIGAEFGFLDNRINVEFDWYTRNNYDLIGVATTAGVGGEVQKYGNIATMKSGGEELSITTQNIRNKDFSWSTSFIFSHTHNEVTDLKTATRVIDLLQGTGYSLQGYPRNSVFSIPFRGLNNEGLPTFLDQDGNITTTGIYFQTSDEEKFKFLEYSGTADPTTTGSLGNIFRYKDFTLNVFVTYSFGNVVRLDPFFKEEYNDLTAMPKEFANRWQVPGDENLTTIPVIASQRQNKNDSNLSYAYSAYNYSTERIAKGDFIRMKEISLAYNVPKKVLKPFHLSNASLKLQATNLFLIYADKKLNGQDPEFFNTGGVAVPMAKQFTFTVKLGI